MYTEKDVSRARYATKVVFRAIDKGETAESVTGDYLRVRKIAARLAWRETSRAVNMPD